MEGLQEKGYFIETDMCVSDITQEIAFGSLEKNKLWYVLKKLPGQDALLVSLLYFEEVTIKKAAEILGCSRKTISNRRVIESTKPPAMLGRIK